MDVDVVTVEEETEAEEEEVVEAVVTRAIR